MLNRSGKVGDQMDQISNISQLFAAQKYKLTPQREAIVNVLLDNEKDHLSVEEVYMLVKNSYPHLVWQRYTVHLSFYVSYTL